MEWEKAISREGEENVYEIPEVWLLPHYYEILTILFRIENALRVFVFSILKNELKSEWAKQSITSDDSATGTIESIARKRINQTKDFGYLGYFVNCPIMYLTTGELIRLITAEAYWKYFADYFPGRKNVIENKLDEIINIRNSIAHFRPIKQGDVEFVKQNAVHVLGEVESSILQITNCRNVVPTNTPDEWYKELKTLGTDEISLSLFFSDNEEWIKIELEYNCPVLYQRNYPRIVFYRLLTIMSPAILRSYLSLTNNIIYLSEDVPSPGAMKKDFIADLTKSINILVSKKTMDKEHEVIYAQIKELLVKISDETQLIRQDNLAKGNIVKAVDVHATYRIVKESGKWDFYIDGMSCNIQEDSPSEFWGNANFALSNFISDTHNYPWMPVSIAKMKLPW